MQLLLLSYWAAQHDTQLLIKLAPKGVHASLFFSLLSRQVSMYLQHLHNVDTRFYCPQMFSYFWCRDDVSERKQMFQD